MEPTALFAAAFAALYAGHHIGDYWVQTDHQARHKGDPGSAGAWICFAHVASYVATQWLCLFLLSLAAGATPVNGWSWNVALGVSATTHYLADRREHGIMLRLARLLPGKADFIRLGVPREGRGDNPSLGTGAWALDQSWHIALGVFVPALIIAAGA